MRRPEPTKREVQRFIKKSQFRFRMELVLDYDRPVSVLEGREMARKLLDRLQPGLDGLERPDELAEASLRCAELKRLLKLLPETA
jgi:hypothetical protein